MERRGNRGTLGAKLLPPRVKGMRRDRLEASLALMWERRLGLVVGPAGSGKTTLLSQFAASCSMPVAWYRADGHDASSAALLGYLERALCMGLENLSGGWQTIEDVVEALAQWGGARALLVVDDLHLLEGTPAESTLARLIDDAPLALTVLVAGRRPPRFNLSRLRVSGLLLELGPDDLRFRSWEVERLFSDFYQETLPPEDLAALARRTEGWAAGLQLFHLATTGKSPRERRRVLNELASGSRVVREYLTRNVLDELPAETSRFLLATSVLSCLTGPLCDRLLGSTGSGEILADLERGQVFTSATDETGTYRYHEVLRAHLEVELVQRLGEDEVRRRYARAGRLLADAGLVAEGLCAYARAGDDQAVARLLGDRGEEVVDGCGAWVDGLPPALVEHDPWLQLAAARRAIAEGRWQDALSAYQTAERLFGPATAMDACRRERLALRAWLDPGPVRRGDWTSVVRMATQRDPLESRREADQLPAAPGRLAAGLAALLAGHPEDATARFAEVQEAEDATPLVHLGARLAGRVAATLAGRRSRSCDFEELALEAERLGALWLARLSRGLIALTGEPGCSVEATMFKKYCEANDDAWGSALASWLQGLADLDRGSAAIGSLADAESGFRALGADTLVVWSQAALAVARAHAGDPGAAAAATKAQSRARAAGVRGAQALALEAMALASPQGREAIEREATAVAEGCGISLEGLVRSSGSKSTPSALPVVELRSLGGFSLAVDGIPVDCSTVKPRARACLRLLAVRVGQPVHKETLVEFLWPEIDTRSGLRNLHVVVSALRQLLEPGVARGASALIIRDGDSYKLVLPPGSTSDLVAFDAALRAAAAARAGGDAERQALALREVLDLYAGELLPDAGPAEWVVGARERYQLDAADAAQALAQVEWARADYAACAAACERGLRVDRRRDRLWRLRIEAAEEAGDRAGSATARSGYAAVLAELGLPAPAVP